MSTEMGNHPAMPSPPPPDRCCSPPGRVLCPPSPDACADSAVGALAIHRFEVRPKPPPTPPSGGGFCGSVLVVGPDGGGE